MKKISMLFLMFLSLSFVAKAGEKDSSFLFPEYQKAEVVYLNGSQSDETVNYNLVDEKLYFIDRSDQRVKVVSDVQHIAAIRIKDKSYLLDVNGFREVIFTDPIEFCVQYKAGHQIVNSNVGYGGTSSVASVSTYSSYRAGGQETIIKQPDIQVSAIYNCYWIGKGNKQYKFTDKNQFLKIYPKQKQKINEYIDTQKLDFNSVLQVAGLVKFAETL